MASLMNPFAVIKKCLSDYNCTFHKALLIKKHKQKLNKQLHEYGLCVYYKYFNFYSFFPLKYDIVVVKIT